jgi:hypothetical protein
MPAQPASQRLSRRPGPEKDFGVGRARNNPVKERILSRFSDQDIRKNRRPFMSLKEQ